ncbi:MAG: anhydro-N-acetylmuramic acid kinase, partial [Methylobacillus sp.]|nr:anhydro-N-acetylmuramic acid kinase [Methylobacillus sp.]
MAASPHALRHFIGLMSGTSLDGVDGVIVRFGAKNCHVIEHAFLPFPETLRDELLALNASGNHEIERSQIAGNALADIYAACVENLVNQSGLDRRDISAVGCHGQTIRHRPDQGYTVQIGNAARLTELANITVIADFRSRDIAAGGQGAPLVPAFHDAVFRHPTIHRAIVNIGGISNISNLGPGNVVAGFDCGPGNLLMDGWVQRHLGLPYDRDGAWASGGNFIPALLESLLAHPFFRLPPPKSTGRDEFHLEWLAQHSPDAHRAEDVQATLLELTARSVADAINRHSPGANEIYLCGGGAYNAQLRLRLTELLHPRLLLLTDALGIPANLVEAAAFAWLASRTLDRQAGNLPTVTGARGARILGAIY